MRVEIFHYALTFRVAVHKQEKALKGENEIRQ